MRVYDFRSDTVTKQTTPAMREAMARADVGDDVYGEDPTVNRLEARAADLLGQEASLFVSSGTMGNLLAALAFCERGSEVIMGRQGHTFLHEAGGLSVLGGVAMQTIPNQADGSLALDDLESALRDQADYHEPVSRLIVKENTQNACGGMPLSAEYTASVGAFAREQGLALHIDGARIFNAAVKLGVPAADLVRSADSVTFCLSKGLCAPVGSMLCGSRARLRRRAACVNCWAEECARQAYWQRLGWSRSTRWLNAWQRPPAERFWLRLWLGARAAHNKCSPYEYGLLALEPAFGRNAVEVVRQLAERGY